MLRRGPHGVSFSERTGGPGGVKIPGRFSAPGGDFRTLPTLIYNEYLSETGGNANLTSGVLLVIVFRASKGKVSFV